MKEFQKIFPISQALCIHLANIFKVPSLCLAALGGVRNIIPLEVIAVSVGNR